MSDAEELLDMFGSSSLSEKGEKDVVEVSVDSGDSGDEIIIGGRLQKIIKQMEREKRADEKRRKEILEGDAVIEAIGANRLRINNNLVLEARKELIATALDVKQNAGDLGRNAFWLLDNVVPFRVVEKMDPRGRPRTDKELERILKRLEDDIKKLEKGQLKRGRNIIRKKKFGDFTLLYWPDKIERKSEVKKIEEIILRPPAKTKQIVTFQNFDSPPPPLSSKVNPWSKKYTKLMDIKDFLRERGIKVDFSLDGQVDSKLRNVSKDRLYSSLKQIKGFDKEEIFEESEVRNIGPNKYDFVRQKVKELNDAGELNIEKDEVGEKIVLDYLSENDSYQKVAMIVYHFRRMDPRIFTKDTLLDYYGNVLSYGLLDHLKNKKKGAVEKFIYGNLLEEDLSENYKYILQLGLFPTVLDEFGRQRQILDPNGMEINLFNSLLEFVENAQFSQNDLREFFVNPEKERITQEQWDVINSEWEIYRVQYDDPADYDSAPGTDSLEPQSAFDLKSSQATLKNEVDALEQSIYSDSENVREYVLKVASILAILELDISNNIKNRLNSGAIGVENLHLLTVEEMLPELFLNDMLKANIQAAKKDSPTMEYLDIIEMEVSKSKSNVSEIMEIGVQRNMSSRFKKWLDTKIFTEANIIMMVYMPLEKKDWFQIPTMPIGFDAKKFAVSEKELCGTLNSNRYYVMTKDGVKCLTSSQIKKSLKELKKYNRKDLEEMINSE